VTRSLQGKPGVEHLVSYIAMCGICGSTASAPGAAVAAMNAAMVHRGPDDGGLHIDDTLGIALGARRLSIIDIAGGHQPIANEDGSVWAVLNGEIYNHPGLQSQLRRRGHSLRTGTDTEVLVHLYEDHGDDLVHVLEGMYAFAVLDAPRGRLLVGRDRFGEKPMFYATHAGAFTFASELDALRAGTNMPLELDPAAVDEFFVLGYVTSPRSIARHVRQLPAGHLLTWTADAPEPEIRRYWSPPPASAVAKRASEPELVAETLRLLTASVRSRMLADVPYGVLLSGGVDSTLIAAIASQVADGRVKTFTVGYDTGAVSEAGAARATAAALGTEHRELILSEAELAHRAPRVLAALDQPIADPALVALHAITEFARGEVTVAIGGEGADELFGGYPRYRWLARAHALDGRVPVPVRRAAARALAPVVPARARRLVDVLEPQTSAERHLDWVTSGRRHARAEVYGAVLRDAVDHGAVARAVGEAVGNGSGASLPAALMALDQRSWLQDDVLAKADRAGMLVSLELRTPYLYRELAEFAARVPPRIHLAGGGKHLLRRALDRVAPHAPRRPKQAFRVPVADWLRGPLRATLEDQLSRSAVYAEGLLDRENVRQRVTRHIDGTRDESAILWPVLVLGLWLDGRR
jgi:asparagine synthase (glutamine-hydrolysing)